MANSNVGPGYYTQQPQYAPQNPGWQQPQYGASSAGWQPPVNYPSTGATQYPHQQFGGTYPQQFEGTHQMGMDGGWQHQQQGTVQGVGEWQPPQNRAVLDIMPMPSTTKTKYADLLASEVLEIDDDLLPYFRSKVQPIVDYFTTLSKRVRENSLQDTEGKKRSLFLNFN